MLGVLPHVAEAVLNHLPAKLIRTYDRNTYTAEKKAALDAWANHLEAIISPTGKTVAVRAVPVEKVAPKALAPPSLNAWLARVAKADFTRRR